ncbi:hypothetical protein LINPERHAP2_LOCUS6505 [Linum perenne]
MRIRLGCLGVMISSSCYCVLLSSCLIMSPSVVLSTMSFDNPDVELQLRLLNSWKVGNPSRPDQFYAFGTLWVDAKGTEIEGTSHRAFADILEEQIEVDTKYELARCPLQMPRKAFRTCFYPRMLAIAPSNIGHIIRSPSLSFPLTSFEYVEFEDLPSRETPCPHLSDVIGRPISISVPKHITATSTNSIMPVQEVVLVNTRFRCLNSIFCGMYFSRFQIP